MSNLIRRLSSATLFVALAVLGANAEAAPLTLYELDQMPLALADAEACSQGPAWDLSECLSGCIPIAPSWEKDNTPPVDRIDYLLAALEYWDGGDGTSVCYEAGAVVPIKACGTTCLVVHTAEGDCEDRDGDGLLGWQETEIGTSDALGSDGKPVDVEHLCESNAECGFSESCEFIYNINESVCRARECGSACTAFHLEQIALNNQELILHVHYDYSPVPATVLDLRVLYSESDLTLVDARALPLLTARNKELSTTHPAAGVVRLVVMGTGSSEPIPTGAIIELVFQRVSTLQTSVGFDLTDYYQRNAMAPSQGANQAALANDSLWGSRVYVPAGDPNGPGLVLWYTFDEPKPGITYNNAIAAASLCEKMGSGCDTAPASEKSKIMAELQALQRGAVATTDTIQGVNGQASYFNGSWDHLELPVSVNSKPGMLVRNQSYSFSTWFIAEGASSAELPGGRQILFSHNTLEERTQLGLLLEPVSPTTARLLWVEGDITSSSRTETVIADGLLLHKWTHVGAAVDVDEGNAKIYLNGVLATELVLNQPAAAFTCPQLGTEVEENVVLHQEGDFGSLRLPPEAIFYSSSRNGIYGIDAIDASGLGRRDVLREPDAVNQDPDYSPVVDKIVYSSNRSGNFEIWIADGDGANRRALTDGFGDTSKGIFARRPRWAPDASAIVFESNAHGGSDNTKGVYHLYYLPYDAANMPALDYNALVARQTIATARITTTAEENHYGAIWLRGRELDNLGEILFTTATETFDNHAVYRATIPDNPSNRSCQGGEVDFGWPGTGYVSQEFSALASTTLETEYQGLPAARLLVRRDWATFEITAEYAFDVSTDAGGQKTVTVRQASTGQPTTIRDLYLTFNDQALTVDIEHSHGTPQMTALAKTVELTAMRLAGVSGAMVRVDVFGRATETIAAGTPIATIVFKPGPEAAQDAQLALKRRYAHQQLYLQEFFNPDGSDATSERPLPLVLDPGRLDTVESAVFSPDGQRLLLAGISRARPILLKAKLLAPTYPRTADAQYTTTEQEKVSVEPMNVEGMSWSRLERYYPCNWVGAYREPYSKRILAGFRGGLDDFKLFNYLREEQAFLSDAQRGFERLHADGRDGVLPPMAPVCGFDSDCPAYYVCINSGCAMVACDPDQTDPMLLGGCGSHGTCTLRPGTVEQENLEIPELDLGNLSATLSSSDWVCDSECSSDSQCFQRDCLNGPCRFCEQGACSECRPVVKDYGGGFTVEEIVGCPDRNSWACDRGSCVSECYSLENGTSNYLCSSVEYCNNGKCEPFQWEWWDLSPASLLGLGEMQFDNQAYTVAIPQQFPVRVEAFGVEDYMLSPLVLVEGKREEEPQVYGGEWFPLGMIAVDNRTQDEAAARPYVVVSPYAIDHLRLRLIVPPYENLNAAATGLGAADGPFCYAEADRRGISRAPCIWRAAGSKFTLGYEIGMPIWQVYADCKIKHAQCIAAGGGESCAIYATCDELGDDTRRPYLRGGMPAVVISSVQIATGESTSGTEVLLVGGPVNNICAYAGTADPTDPLGPPDGGGHRPPAKVVFGNLFDEQSNEKELFCEKHPGVCVAGARSVEEFPVVNKYDGSGALTKQGRGFALLNCDYFNPSDQDHSATLVLDFLPPAVSLTAGNITETANGCYINGQNGGTSPCYEFEAGDVSMDIMNPGPVGSSNAGVLTYDLFKNFAYDTEEMN